LNTTPAVYNISGSERVVTYIFLKNPNTICLCFLKGRLTEKY